MWGYGIALSESEPSPFACQLTHAVCGGHDDDLIFRAELRSLEEELG